jgi:hypothetical protein
MAVIHGAPPGDDPVGPVGGIGGVINGEKGKVAVAKRPEDATGTPIGAGDGVTGAGEGFVGAGAGDGLAGAGGGLVDSGRLSTGVDARFMGGAGWFTIGAGVLGFD